MSRISALPLVLAVASACPSPSQAQGKDAFVNGLIEVTRAADGTFGDEGPALITAIDAMAAGLSQWDAAIARAEAGLSTEIGGAPPAAAARMRTALGTIYLERGRLDAALAQFKTAADLDPQFPVVYVLRGTALRATGRTEEAAAAYRAAWDRDPGSASAAYLFLRSSHDAQSAEAQAAQRTLSSAVEQRGSSGGDASPVRFLAVSLLDDASVPEPAFPPASYAEAFDLIGQARYGEAVARLREIAAVDPLVTDSALRSSGVGEAIAALKKDDTATAIPGLVAAVERAPGSSELHRVLGVAYWAAKRYEESLEQLRIAVRLNSQDERARIAIADVLVAAGNVPQAREELAATLQAIPRSARASWKLGRLHQTLGDGLNAVRSFIAAAGGQPYAGAGHLFAAIGLLQHTQLDLDGAASTYERRIDVTPNDVAAHADLGDVYRAQDRMTDAMREYQVAALLDPDSVRALAAIGQLHAVAGRDDDAVLILRRTVSLDPAHLEARYALSRALLRLGRTEEARIELGIFEQLQTKAMNDERRRFQENQITIEQTLKDGAGREGAR